MVNERTPANGGGSVLINPASLLKAAAVALLATRWHRTPGPLPIRRQQLIHDRIEADFAGPVAVSTYCYCALEPSPGRFGIAKPTNWSASSKSSIVTTEPCKA